MAAEGLLKKYTKGIVRPNVDQPDSLRTPGPNGEPVSMLIAFCGAAGAKAHAFLAKILLPIVEELASAKHDGQPVGSETFSESKEVAGTHLLAGARAAISARNTQSLGLLYQMACRHFPRQLPAFIEGYLRTDPRFAKVFIAAGVPSQDVHAMLLKSRMRVDDVGGRAASAADSLEPAQVGAGPGDPGIVGAEPRRPADVVEPAPAPAPSSSPANAPAAASAAPPQKPTKS
ncbi:MAG: hypothetical protein JWQ11_4798 [Rhizobacter sp.]|nr:hypothetical protein [Rhizobacter sp.]